MYCPTCGAEYRRTATTCSDCQVALVAELPGQSPENAVAPGTTFSVVWSGSDSRRFAEVCESLEREKIPVSVVNREDLLFIPVARPGFEVYVPSSFAAEAKEILSADDALEEEAEEVADSDAMEAPAEDDFQEIPERGGELKDCEPEDATAEIWSGQNSDLAGMITMSLRENQIYCRADSDEAESESVAEPVQKLFVLPEDESRAKEIIREIVDAVPPE